MPADYMVKAGDTGPYLTDTLTYSDQSAVDLTGATVTIAIRSLSSPLPVTVTGTVSVVSATDGAIQYAPSAADTATPGNYMASWVVVFPGGQRMSFPTDGYLWLEIQPSVTTETQQLVGLPEVKQWLRIDASQRDYDDELLELVEAVRPEIESIVGPVIPQIFDEWYDGGSTFISLRHRPSFGYGTSPLLTIIGVSEYIGPIEWPLALIPSPDLGQIYSAMLNPASGTLTRRTAGGGISGFQPGRDQVHVVYQSGQQKTPANVRAAVRETVRVHFRTTAQVGRGSEALADVGDTAPMGFWLPRKAREMLGSTRKAPAVA
jgi:hypothetical protein